MQNKIVVHFRGGRVLKGHTYDFSPQRPTFHLVVTVAGGERKTLEVSISELKAVFFVKTFTGNKTYVEKKEFAEVGAKSPLGLKMKITFYDGEIISGASAGYSRERQGFFVTPIDPGSNNERVYVVSDAVVDVKVGGAAVR